MYTDEKKLIVILHVNFSLSILFDSSFNDVCNYWRTHYQTNIHWWIYSSQDPKSWFIFGLNWICDGSITEWFKSMVVNWKRLQNRLPAQLDGSGFALNNWISILCVQSLNVICRIVSFNKQHYMQVRLGLKLSCWAITQQNPIRINLNLFEETIHLTDLHNPRPHWYVAGSWYLL